MTTPRTRRNAMQQAEDALEKLLAKQEAEVDKRYAALQDAQAKLYKTRRVLAALGEEDSPEEPSRIVPVPRPLEGIGAKALLRQGSVGQAQGINDVWSATPGETVVSVHSELMYARQDLCEWCKAGVPFATEKREEHYIVTKRVDGVVRGFEYKRCTGIKE